MKLSDVRASKVRDALQIGLLPTTSWGLFQDQLSRILHIHIDLALGGNIPSTIFLFLSLCHDTTAKSKSIM